jgi:hypothetical protein
MAAVQSPARARFFLLRSVKTKTHLGTYPTSNLMGNVVFVGEIKEDRE